jgi:hypothetical protein
MENFIKKNLSLILLLSTILTMAVGSTEDSELTNSHQRLLCCYCSLNTSGQCCSLTHFPAPNPAQFPGTQASTSLVMQGQVTLLLPVPVTTVWTPAQGTSSFHWAIGGNQAAAESQPIPVWNHYYIYVQWHSGVFVISSSCDSSLNKCCVAAN